jgi:hypothetical protein
MIPQLVNTFPKRVLVHIEDTVQVELTPMVRSPPRKYRLRIKTMRGNRCTVQVSADTVKI